MKFTFTCKKISLNDSIKAYAEKKISKLDRYFQEEPLAFVTFAVEKDHRCVAEVTIRSGDIVFGDIDGVLIIPKEVASEVVEKALIKASTEKTMRKAIEEGMLVTDAFARFGVL